MKKLKYIVGASCLILVAMLVTVAVRGTVDTVKAQGGGGTELSGWAWASNIGWVSFNSANQGAGSGAAYRVTVSTTTGSTIGSLAGYAWSSSLGWISFNSADLAGCPGASAPVINMTTSGPGAGQVSGWARVLSAKSGADGWLGCVELSNSSSGATNPSPTSATFEIDGVTFLKGGVTYTEQQVGNTIRGFLKGFAWSDKIIGWLNFDLGTEYGVSVGCTNCGTGGEPLSGTCTASYGNRVYNYPSSIQLPSSGIKDVVLSVLNLSGGTGSYNTPTWRKYTGATGVTAVSPYTMSFGVNGSTSAQSYDPSVIITDTNENTATLLCPNVNVAGASSGLDLSIGKTVDTALQSVLDVKKGEQFVLRWQRSSGMTGCDSDVDYHEDWTALDQWGTSVSGSYTFTGGVPQSAAQKQYRFSISCINTQGTRVTDSVTLNVVKSTVQED